MAGAPRAYSNRTDLTDRPQHGEKAALARSQAQMPVAAPAQAPPPQDLLRATERPNEPVTAGAPFGAGPGMEAVAGAGIQAGSREDLALRVRAIASRFPNSNLLALLDDLETPR